MDYFKPNEGPVDHYETKYDGCIIKGTGTEYRWQKGSGRSEVIQKFAKDGMTVSEFTKVAAEGGFDPNFAIQSILKHGASPGPSFYLVGPDGTAESLAEVIKQRQPRRVDEATLQKRATKAEQQAQRAKEREDRKTQKEAEKSAKAQEKAAKDAQKAESGDNAEAEAAAKLTGKTGKGKRKKAETAPAPETTVDAGTVSSDAVVEGDPTATSAEASADAAATTF